MLSTFHPTATEGLQAFDIL